MNARAFYLALGVFCLDQAAAYWRVQFHSSQVILNAHSAWWLSIVTLLLCLLALSKSHAAISLYAATLLIAGGASNLLDRFLYNGVVDYLFLGRLAFNLADATIVTGVALLLLCFMSE